MDTLSRKNRAVFCQLILFKLKLEKIALQFKNVYAYKAATKYEYVGEVNQSMSMLVR